MMLPNEDGELNETNEEINVSESEVRFKRLKRARRAANISVGSLKSLKKQKSNHNQSFALRQASALQRKNRDIVTELAKVRRYCTQLERMNQHFKDQMFTYKLKICSFKRKLADTNALYEQTKNTAIFNNEHLLTLQTQLSNAVRGIEIFRSQTQNNLTQIPSSVKEQPKRIIRTENKSEESSSDDQEPVLKSMSKKCERISPEAGMSLLEEEDDPESEEEIIEDDNSSSSSFTDQEVAEEERDQDLNCSFEEEEDVENNELNKADIGLEYLDEESSDNSMDRFSENEEHGTEDVNDLQLHVSFSSVSSNQSEKSESIPIHDRYPSDLVEENVTSHEEVSMEMTFASNIVEAAIETGKDISNESNTARESVCNNENNTNVLESNASGKTEKRKSKPRQPLKEKVGNKKRGRPKKIRDENIKKDNSTYDVFSCSSDSFVLDPNKGIKLNSSNNFSKKEKAVKFTERHSDPGTFSKENEPIKQRPSRRRTQISYTEPSLSTKMRRGDRFSDNSMYAPKKKKRGPRSGV